MKKLVAALAAALVLTAHADTMTSWVAANSHEKIAPGRAQQFVDAAKSASHRHGVDLPLVLAVMRKETGFRTRPVSREGARGVMQVIPRWHPEKIRGRDISSLPVGADVGTQILAEYIREARGDVRKALRKYSGGSRRYAEEVLAIRASIVMSTGDASRHVIALSSPYSDIR